MNELCGVMIMYKDTVEQVISELVLLSKERKLILNLINILRVLLLIVKWNGKKNNTSNSKEAMTGRTAPSSDSFLVEVYRGFPQL